jgi:hypothetical protein
MRRILLLALAASLICASAAAKAAPVRWHTYRVSGAPRLADVRCPSTSVCVAMTHAGYIFTTRNASAAHPTWRQTTGLKVMGSEESYEQTTAYNLSCPSIHLCVTSSLSQIITTTDPTGPASGWHGVDIQPPGLDFEGRLDSLTCPTTTRCMAGLNEWSNEEGGGTAVYFASTDDPTGPASAWTITNPPANQDYVITLACSPGGVCAAGGDYSEILATNSPVTTAATWTTVGTAKEQLNDVTCPSGGLCVGSDYNGHLLSSIRPATNGSWTEAALPGGRYVGAISCAANNFCAAVGGDRKHLTGVLTATHPGDPSAYALTTFSARGDRLNAISCRSSTFCVAVGDHGLVAVRRRG